MSKREQNIINIRKAVEKAKFKDHKPIDNNNRIDYNSISTHLESDTNEAGHIRTKFGDQAIRLKQVDYWGSDDGDLGYEEDGTPIRSNYIEEFDHVELDYYPKNGILVMVNNGERLTGAFVENILGYRWKAWFGENYDDGKSAEAEDVIYVRNHLVHSDYAIYKLDGVGYSPEKYIGGANVADLFEDEDDDDWDEWDDEDTALTYNVDRTNGRLVDNDEESKGPKYRMVDGHVEEYYDDEED